MTHNAYHPARDADAIAIGASAGGVDALSALLAAVPADFAPAMLIVLHLPPGRPSSIAELLGRHCALPVMEALDKMPIAGSTVILAPPDYHMLVEAGPGIALSVDEPVLYSRPAIDPLFESSAALYGERLLAILLTGASEDGSVGIAAVRRAGGQAWVQAPEDAKVSTMPASAIARSGADEVMTLDAMCKRFASREP